MTHHDPLITRGQALELLGGVSRRTLYNWVQSGRLPPPVRLSPRVVGWRRSTLEALLASPRPRQPV
jgi:predicted DNA-binding transcriptional regulator AlpA